MSAHTLVSEDEYLHTPYQPDCEYRDGELLERNLGERGHSRMQRLLTTYLSNRQRLWNTHVYPELRIRLRAGHYRIPDIAVFLGDDPTEPVPTTPPLLWIEILSPEDRPIRVSSQVRELLELGVPYVWVIDPETLESELHTPQGGMVLSDGILRIPNTPIEIPLRALEA